MSIELANRLAALRKEHKLNQEELAEKLGVSRQAISKWERGESSPDTDNLLGLAEIYGISLDELVGGKKEETPEPEPVPAEVVDGPIEEDDKEDEPELSRMGQAQKVIGSVGFVLATVAYLLLGFLWKGPTGTLGWASCWVVFLLPILIMGTLSAIEDRRPSRFPIALLVVGVYCGVGIITTAYGFTQWWHPFWILFFLIPLYHVVTAVIEAKVCKR